MPFGLKNAPTIVFQVVVASYKDLIHKFLQVYMDDWTVYGMVKDNLSNLQLMLKRC